MGAKPRAVSLYKTYLTSLDWLFPPRCAGCGRLGSHWCAECQARVLVIEGTFCPRCGLPKANARLCGDCRDHEPAFDEARAWGRYNAALRPPIVALKYRSNQGLGWTLAEKLVYHPARLAWRVAGIIPVPLANERLHQRGHNQAELLARPLAMLTEIPLYTNALKRQRETPKQVGLSVHERRQNMLNAFAADDAEVRGKNLLLIDDVMTTGATLDAAAAALKGAGAARVYALALARATL